MKKSTINHLEELYKDEIDSHYLKKAINNINISSLKIKDLEDKRKLSDKNTKYNQYNKVKNSLLFNNNIKKNSININLFKSKEKIDNLFDNSNSEESQKKKKLYMIQKLKREIK